MLRNAKIRTRLAAMAVVPIALIAVLAVASYLVVQNLSVNGPAYNRIARSKDFVAETSNSNLYILRASVISHQAVINRSPGQRAGLLGEMDTFVRDYRQLYDLWLPRVTDPRVRENLIASHEAAEQYFELFNSKFRGDVSAGDYDSAIKLLNGDMDTAFITHEAAIELIKTNSEAAQKAEETRAEKQKQRDSRVLGAMMILLALITAALGFSTLRSILRRLDRLRDVATRELPRTIESVKAAALAGEELPPFEPVQVGGRDELTETGAAFNSVVGTAVELAADQARTRRATAEMFVNLGRRNHKLLSRTLTYISQLERDERDPSTLQNLFKLDHLTTRMRRHAESLLVLAGSAPLRTWSRPVPVSDVLRSALSEIESYDRVDVTGMDEVFVKGAVVSDVAHLLAELLENATTFSPPHTRVRVVGRGNAKRYHVIVVDEGIGMTADDLMAANEMLAHGHEQGVEALGSSRMLGLGVVARLAARHAMVVGLDDSPVGGVVAKITLPPAVLADAATLESLPSAPPRSQDQADAPFAPPSTGSFAALGTGSFAAPGTGSFAPAPSSAPAPSPAGPVTAPITTALPRRNAAAAQPAAAAEQVIDLRQAEPAAPTRENGEPPGAPLRRRVRGAQLPEAAPSTPPTGPPVSRDADAVRSALSNFSLGRRGGEAAAKAAAALEGMPPAEPSPPVAAAPAAAAALPAPTTGSTAGPNGTNGHSGGQSGQQGNGHGPVGLLSAPQGNGLPMRPLPTRTPGSTGAGDLAPGSSYRFAAEPEAPLRRRVRGAQLPDMSTPAPPAAPPADRTADSVRQALSSFVSGQRSARDG
ncbi:MAG: ATP-binding protein [Kineosporiaceae bacterium]